MCNYAQVRGCRPCAWGWDLSPEGREHGEEGGIKSKGRKSDAVKLEKIWLFYARLLR